MLASVIGPTRVVGQGGGGGGVLYHHITHIDIAGFIREDTLNSTEIRYGRPMISFSSKTGVGSVMFATMDLGRTW